MSYYSGGYYPQQGGYPQQATPQLTEQQTQQYHLNHLPGMLPLQQSYIENILRLNKGRMCRVYMSFPKSSSWASKTFEGTIEAAGRDHIILSDPTTNHRFVLLTIYLDFIEFDSEIKYVYP